MIRNNILRNLLIYLGLLLICSFALSPLFHAGYFTMQDDEQIARLQQLYLILSQGQFPPRWIPDLGFGFGYPLFTFYPPLVYYVGAFLHFLHFSFINSTKIVFGLGFFLSAVTMFYWVKKHYGVIAGFFAALLYIYAPYHSVDSYVRGSLSEFFSWIFVPLIFLVTDLLFEKKERKYIIFFGISFALLMLSHTLVMLQFAPIFIIYVGLLFLKKEARSWKALWFLILGGLLGLGLTAYFWLPSILEKQYTLVDAVLTTQLANYALHFVCPIQLWSSPWGYGGSVPGCVDGLSFQVGKIQAIVGVLGILGSIYFLFKKRLTAAFIGSVLLLCSVFFTLDYSKFLWDVAKPFWYIQFPWRYLLFVAIFSAFLGGFVISFIEKRFNKKVALVIAIILAVTAMIQIRNYFKPQAYRYVTDAQMTSQQEIQRRVSSMSYEYSPYNEPTKLSALGTTELQIADLAPQGVNKSYASISGVMKIQELENISYLKKYTVTVYNNTSKSSGIFQVNTFVFPGWVVYVNGRQQQLVNNYYHLIQVQLPVGKHTVEVLFTDTKTETIANIISLISVMILILGSISLRKKKI